MGNCTEDDGQGIGNGKPENGRPEKPGSGKPGSGSGKPEIDRPERPDNSTTRPEFPEKPADCKCPRLPLRNRQIKTGIKYEYSQNDGELTMST